MGFQVSDRVLITDENGSPVAEGTIVNVNDFREPSLKYAVDVDGYMDDVLFFGDSKLKKKE